jgi:DNA-binding NtrC family response regulator
LRAGLTTCLIKNEPTQNGARKGNEMRSTHKRWTHSHEESFVPVKALLPGRKGKRDRRVEDLHEKLTGESQEIFGDQTSGPAQTMRAEIERVARRSHNILITGETGTGKTHTAREIHRRSARSFRPFMELNCANLPEQLVEAELFGYRKGAFTGADRDHMGVFEEANGGILFLDEIGDIPLTVQNRLLKAIDEKQFKRLGTNHYVYCDVQIIAATSRNLPMMIHEGEFREDLYCRLAVLTVETTPLRDRREDIPAMIALFLREAAPIPGSDEQHCSYRFEEDALSLLYELNYPGNIRALRNLIFQLTSYVDENQPISIQLVQFVLAKLRSREGHYLAGIADGQLPSSDPSNCVPSETGPQNIDQISLQSFLSSTAGDGDIILPLELCVLRREETFKQWTARAKRCSIEAARQTSGASMRSVAERLGLTRDSLWSHLRRARRDQNESLFDWEPQSD